MMIEIKRVELRSRGSSFTSNLGPFKDLGEASPSRDGGGEAGGLIMDDIRSAYLWVVILMLHCRWLVEDYNSECVNVGAEVAVVLA